MREPVQWVACNVMGCGQLHSREEGKPFGMIRGVTNFKTFSYAGACTMGCMQCHGGANNFKIEKMEENLDFLFQNPV